MQAFCLSILLLVFPVTAIDCNLPIKGTHNIITSCESADTVQLTTPDARLSFTGKGIEETVVTRSAHDHRLFHLLNHSKLSVTNMTLSGGSINWAVFPAVGSPASLVLVSTGASLHATNVKFMHGIATQGGAILVQKFENTIAILVSCIFYRNSAGHGGALSHASLGVTYQSVSSDGLPEYKHHPSFKIVSCLFLENRAHIGGAFFNAPQTRQYINSSTFDSNTAQYQGGVVYTDTFQGNLGQTIPTLDTQLYLHNVVFKDNSAPYGGVAYLSGFDNGAVMKKVRFLRNVAVKKGGVMFSSGQLKLEQSQVINSSCTIDDSLIANEAGQGGAFFVAGGELILNDVVIKGSTVTGRGGAIFSRPGTSLSISKSTFMGNTAVDGSAIFNEGKLRIRSSLFVQNRIKPSLLKAPVVESNCRAPHPCAIGGADCNMDGDCEQGLICYQRRNGERVPGVELMDKNMPCSSTVACTYFCHNQLCDKIGKNWGVCTFDVETLASAVSARTAAVGNILWIVNTSFQNNHFLLFLFHYYQSESLTTVTQIK